MLSRDKRFLSLVIWAHPCGAGTGLSACIFFACGKKGYRSYPLRVFTGDFCFFKDRIFRPRWLHLFSPFLYAYVFVENILNEAKIPEIRETGEEKALSLGRLKHDCLKFAKQTFQGRTFVNRDMPIRVSQDGLMEWWRKSRKRDHAISIKLLNFFLENAVFQGDAPDYKNRPEIESVSRFETFCKINGKPYKVVITTRKAVNDINKFRYYTLKDVEMAEK